MISFSNVWALARAELRTIRRLVRFWMFAVLATIIGLLTYFYYSFLHGLFSNISGSIGSISPKFLMGQFALTLTLVFAVGLIFLAFDVRARDQRDRMVEVLDTRPYSNLELVLGRFLGTLLAVWTPVLFLMLLIQGYATLAESLGWWVGEVVVWASIFHYLLLDALPAFTFYIAFVYLVSLLIKNRLVAAIAALVLLGLSVWIGFRLPLYIIPIVGINGGSTSTASEVAPRLFGGEALVYRGTVLLAALGLLGLAAAVHPRLDSGRKKVWGLAGGALVAIAALLLVFSVTRARAGIERGHEWRDAHLARVDEPVPDLERMAGTVNVRPGRSLDLDLELTIAGPIADDGADESGVRSISNALFSLNPGIEVQSVTDSSGGALTFTHEDGLLDVQLPRPLTGGDSATLKLQASGAPDPSFSYLDSAIRFLEVSGQQAQLGILGADPGYFTKSYAALLPGVVWLPRAGVSVALDDPRKRPLDYFDLDLEVTVPDGFQVAAPGKQGSTGAGPVHLKPGAPVPEVALIVGRYERRATDIEGVQVELLYDADHSRNVEFFTDAMPEIEKRAAELFSSARDLGLPYPYPTLTLVEVPWSLRSFGGGWRMDTVQSPAGLLLLSEGAFPTARFEFPFRNPDRFEEQEGGIERAKLEALERFFENDFSGGNVLYGFVRNLFLDQTSARGPEALALNELCQDLVNKLITGREAYFSAHIFDASMGWVIAQTIPQVAVGQASGETVAHALISAATDRPAVWDTALDASLTDIDPWDDPKNTVDVLALKGATLARSILDGAGRQKVGRMLAVLVRDHRGETFDVEDLRAAATEAEIDLDALLGDFLHRTALPGFMVSAARIDRLPDDDQGLPQYQTRLFVRNGEPVPGLLRLRYSTTESQAAANTGGPGRGRRNIERRTWETSEPVRVAGETSIELGLVTSKPPTQLFVSPYLSLNRRDFPVELPKVDEEKTVDIEPLRGARPADWMPTFADPRSGQIVVDDLDDGFQVDEGSESDGLRLGGGIAGAFRPPDEMDNGLPAQRMGQPPKTWSRTELDDSWGRYRRTAAIVAKGDGSHTATFSADLPAAGRWRVELFLPPRPTGRAAVLNQGWRFGTYDLTLTQGSDDRPIEFDAGAAEPGWSSLGDFQLQRGEVDLTLSDDTSGSLVIADAVRFVPLNTDSAGDQTTGGAP